MNPLSLNIRWQLWIVAFAFFMQSLDTTIVNTALPSMADSLHTSAVQMRLIIVAYVLTVAVMLPACGWLADKVGVRRIFCLAIVIFTLGSLCCALAETLNQLILARIFQGVGGAMLVPVGRLIVMKIVPRSQYMSAMVFVTTPGQVGPLIGPTLGGLLVQYVSWHWIFLINIPVGMVGAWIAWRIMPNVTMPTHRFDSLGFTLLALAMTVLTIAIDGHSSFNLSAPQVIGLASAGCLALVLYFFHARGNSRALFPLGLFHIRTFSIGSVGSLFGRIGSGMLPFMTPLFLQIRMGFSPFHAGLLMIFMVLGNMGMKRIVVNVVNRFGYRMVLVSATLLLSLVTLSFPFIANMSSTTLIVVALFCQGTVNALRFSTMNNLTIRDLPDQLTSSGNSLLSMIMQLSMSLGVTVAGVLLGLFSHHILHVSGTVLSQIFMDTYIWMAVVIALPALIFWHVPARLSDNAVM